MEHFTSKVQPAAADFDTSTIYKSQDFPVIYLLQGISMKQKVANLFKNELFLLLLNGVICYTAFVAIVIATLQVPPDAILDSGLQEIIMVFEGD